MFLVNGMASGTIPLSNRSFQYGDGCFTTILVRSGVPQLWERHLERLKACLQVLQIPMPDPELLRSQVEQVAQCAPLSGVKLHISRGSGSRGYGISGSGEPVVTVSSFDYPAAYRELQASGIELGISSIRLGHQPLLAGHKHNNRLEQVLIKAEIEQRGWQDAVVLDLDGNVTEACAANLFWVDQNGVVLTPELSKAGVNGVMRRQVMAVLDELGMPWQEQSAGPDSLYAASEVWMTNALMEVVPVTRAGEAEYQIGPVTRQIQEKISSC